MSKKNDNHVKIGNGNSIKNSNLGINSRNKKEHWIKNLLLGIVASIIAAGLIALWSKYKTS